MVKTKEKFTLKNRVVYDPITKKFTQKGYIVRGVKVTQYPEGICEYCSNKYPKHRVKQRFCSSECRMKWWIRQQHNGQDPDYGMTNCVICGKEFQRTRPWHKYCCLECQAEGRKRLSAEKRQEEISESVSESV